MTTYDLVVKGGTLIDGTGSPAHRADLGISDGRIESIGEVAASDGAEVLDADGLIVAPGVIDMHTHYDAQLHWDPYCRDSGSHGATTVVISNCGFGFAPCKPELRGRYMQMMERTEQVPTTCMERALPWTWESFPEWMSHLKQLPKGVNVAAYVPLNPLMIYVMGIDAAKSRRPSPDELVEIRQLLNEGLDEGAIGFAFTWLGPVNNHVDIDGGPMPTDVMDIEVAYELAPVLASRKSGVIMVNCDVNTPGLRSEREVAAELARRSGQTVVHNIVNVVSGSNRHEEVMAWLSKCSEEGLDVYSQGVMSRTFLQFAITEYTSWDVLPILRQFTSASPDEKMRMAADPDYRRTVDAQLDPDRHAGSALGIHQFRLASAEGNDEYASYVPRRVSEIASQQGKSVVDAFFDILVATELKAEFTHLERSVSDPAKVGPVLRHPRVLAGVSDGGAHVKFTSGGQYSTDLLTWLSRDSGQFSMEEMHFKLSALPAQVLGLQDRGTLELQKRADMMIYDLERLGYQYGSYEKAFDLPDGGWRRVSRPQGIEYIAVNGQVTMRGGEPSGCTPGMVVSGTKNAVRTS